MSYVRYKPPFIPNRLVHFNIAQCDTIEPLSMLENPDVLLQWVFKVVIDLWILDLMATYKLKYLCQCRWTTFITIMPNFICNVMKTHCIKKHFSSTSSTNLVFDIHLVKLVFPLRWLLYRRLNVCWIVQVWLVSFESTWHIVFVGTSNWIFVRRVIPK